MEKEDTSIKQLFDRYQKANEDFDVNAIAEFYADAFLFGQPQGTQTVKKDDFIQVLPRRKALMEKTGQQSSVIASLKDTRLDDQYIQVEIVWKMTYKKDGKLIDDLNGTTYILYKKDSSLQIVVQIDHQDLMKKVQALGLLTSV